MNELSLEEILKIVGRVKKWTPAEDTLFYSYIGDFYLAPGNRIDSPSPGKIFVSKTNPAAIEGGIREGCYVYVGYHENNVAGLSGKEASEVYKRLSEIINAQSRAEFENLESEKSAKRERIMERVNAKKMPISRRLGR